MNTLLKRSLLATALCAVLISAGYSIPAYANPSQTPPIKSLNNTASTTQVYMTPGTATTTLTYDSFSVSTDTKFDQVTIAMQVHASGTPVTVKFRVEDSYNGIDWYPRSTTITTGTTTIVSGSFSEYSIQIATSSDLLGGTGAVLGVTTRVHQEVTVDTPMRYSRYIFYLPPGSGNAALWAVAVPVREKQDH